MSEWSIYWFSDITVSLKTFFTKKFAVSVPLLFVKMKQSLEESNMRDQSINQSYAWLLRCSSIESAHCSNRNGYNCVSFEFSGLKSLLIYSGHPAEHFDIKTLEIAWGRHITIRRSIDCLLAWSFGWSIDWLIDRLIEWLMVRLVHSFVRSVDWLIDLSVNRLLERCIDWLI